ncbi:MAG: glutamate--tRNA ligase [Elusimicrobia bacterium]|nr:glutamate--tRNA ligase [Elusimicrobiota bacterium]MBD3412168.1 glutamate--tRNA ligase [Elusimicrobiota bacterium]
MNAVPVRVRFAPSPTGFLHIGGARTALFNWLFARHHGGRFILRIEDTDEKRSTPESIQAIIDGLSWLGLDWDEGPDCEYAQTNREHGSYGPYFQMQRLTIYTQWSNTLRESGKAYPCWCKPDDVEKARAQALQEKKKVLFTDPCRTLEPAQVAERLQQNKPYVIRYKVEPGDDPNFDDIIHGRKDFDPSLIEDFIILKSTGGPTYNFAAVVDDNLMGITHVIRGDDHLSNTPRQVLLYRALGMKPPLFAHLPMILGPDGTRLSKRHGATSLKEYRQGGYLAEAMVNYLVLLGWSTTESQQLFKLDEMIHKFSLDRCSKSPAIFDPPKLLWMNGEYVRGLDPSELTKRAIPWLRKSSLLTDGTHFDRIREAVSLEQEKIKRLDEIPHMIEYMLRDSIEFEPEAVQKWLHGEDTGSIIAGLKNILDNINAFSAELIEQKVREFCKTRSIKTARVFHPLRVAVSGRTRGPSLFHMISFIGRERITQRLERALEMVNANKAR